jgi:hypothetical protein
MQKDDVCFLVNRVIFNNAIVKGKTLVLSQNIFNVEKILDKRTINVFFIIFFFQFELK